MVEAERRFGHEARLVMTSEPIRNVYDVPMSKQEPSFKPVGLWYGCGLDWLDWVVWNMPHWVGPYMYGLDVDLDYMKVIRDAEGIRQLTRGYADPGDSYIVRWREVAEEYDGIEICPYISSERMSRQSGWYYTWDVASGCIWNTAAVRGLRELAAPRMP